MLSATAAIRLVGYLLGSIFQRKLGYSKHIVEFMYRKRKQPCQINHLTRLLSPMKKPQERLQQGFLIKKQNADFLSKSAFYYGGPADSLIELARFNLRKVRGFQLAVYA